VLVGEVLGREVLVGEVLAEVEEEIERGRRRCGNGLAH
jgi:hypothetical protein